MIYLYWTLGVVVLFILTFAFYLAVMNLKDNQDKITKVNAPFIFLLLAIAYPLDILFNVIIGTPYFLELPKEFLFTTRLNRHLNDRTLDWRDRNSDFFAEHFLDPFTLDGKPHVKRPTN